MPSTVDEFVADAVCRRFGGFVAVDGVSLTLRPGDRHALVGPNGAGKTTLLDLLAGTVTPSAGRIRWRGRDITRWGPARRARAGIARSFQTPVAIATLSTVENLVLGAWPHLLGPTFSPSAAGRRWSVGRRYRWLRERVLALAEELGLAGCLDTPARQLSHGQRRLLDLGMALAGRPAVLLLDEPAAGLHGTAELDRLLGLLQRLPSSLALLLVEHHLDVVAALATTVTVLDRGRVLASGTPAQVGTADEVRRVYPGLAEHAWLAGPVGPGSGGHAGRSPEVTTHAAD